MPFSPESIIYVDHPLSGLASQPDQALDAFDTPFATMVTVDQQRSKGEVIFYRDVLDASRTGLNLKRPPGGAYARFPVGDPSTVSYECEERAIMADLDYTTIGRALDPLALESTAVRKGVKLVKMDKCAEIATLCTTAGNWDASSSGAWTAMGLGSSGVVLSNAASTPLPDFYVMGRLCSNQNGGIWPHYLVINETALDHIAISRLGDRVSNDKAVREVQIREAHDALEQHIGMTVYVRNARENGTLLWPDDAFMGYRSDGGDIVPTVNGAQVPPVSFACVHETIPDVGLTGDLYVKRCENAEKSGIMVGAISSWDTFVVDTKAAYLATTIY